MSSSVQGRFEEGDHGERDEEKGSHEEQVQPVPRSVRENVSSWFFRQRGAEARRMRYVLKRRNDDLHKVQRRWIDVGIGTSNWK